MKLEIFFSNSYTFHLFFFSYCLGQDSVENMIISGTLYLIQTLKSMMFSVGLQLISFNRLIKVPFLANVLRNKDYFINIIMDILELPYELFPFIFKFGKWD